MWVIRVFGRRAEPWVTDFMTGETRRFKSKQEAATYARLSFGKFESGRGYLGSKGYKYSVEQEAAGSGDSNSANKGE